MFLCNVNSLISSQLINKQCLLLKLDMNMPWCLQLTLFVYQPVVNVLMIQ